MTAHLFGLDASDVATTTDDWYTPRWIFDAAGIVFDTDVAAPISTEAQTVPARTYLTALEDGLSTPWSGVVWCNPPYSGSTPWVEKWAAHPEGMILVPAVKSRWIGTLVAAADALALLTVEFHRPGGETAPIRWLNILAGRGSVCADAVARVARDDHHARGAYMVRPR
jgi:hypothetical protein